MWFRRFLLILKAAVYQFLSHSCPHLPPRLRFPHPRTAMLLVLVMATLLMPVDYRAGANHEHAHTIFQGLVDSISGHPHHHAGNDTITSQHRTGISPFAPVAIPLSVLAAAGSVVDSDTGDTSSPDIPHQLGLSAPITSATAILTLGALIVALLTGPIARPLWGHGARLADWCSSEESPPPRLA